MWAATHEAIAEDMHCTMATLRGFWVKLGQYAVRASLIRLNS